MAGNRSWAKWTSEEVVLLCREWHNVDARTLRARLSRHSWTAIRRKAEERKLAGGIPQGCEGLNAAARRLGVNRDTIVRMLRDASVRVRRVYPKRGGNLWRSRLRAEFADRDEIDAAFVRWMNSETLYKAARERGLTWSELLARVERVGGLPEGYKPGPNLRVETSLVERAMQQK